MLVLGISAYYIVMELLIWIGGVTSNRKPKIEVNPEDYGWQRNSFLDTTFRTNYYCKGKHFRIYFTTDKMWKFENGIYATTMKIDSPMDKIDFEYLNRLAENNGRIELKKLTEKTKPLNANKLVKQPKKEVKKIKRNYQEEQGYGTDSFEARDQYFEKMREIEKRLDNLDID